MKIQEQTGFHFKALRTWGKIISVFGWILVLAGSVTAIIAGLLILEDGPGGEVFVLLGGLVAVLIGFSYIVFGQLISCFVEIEKNTRTTYQMLERNKE